MHDGGGLLDLGDRAAPGVELVLEPGGLVGEGAGGLDHDGEVGDLEGDALVGADRPAEGDPGPGVVGRGLEARLRAADGERADGDPAVVEGLEELLEALAPARRAGGRPARGSR